MKLDALLVIVCIIFIYAAWVVTGGPARAFSQQGPFITPITRPGEEQQAYRNTAPGNPLNPDAYPTQVKGTITNTPDTYTRTSTSSSDAGKPRTVE